MSTPVNAATDGFFAPLHFPEYRTTIKRNPTNDLIMVPERLGEISGPVFGDRDLGGIDNDMTQANGGEFGLSSAVYTRDLTRGVRFARRIEAGMTHVNDITVNDEAHVMFGGEKNSGLGRFNGEWAIDAFTTEHWVGVAPGNAQFPF